MSHSDNKLSRTLSAAAQIRHGRVREGLSRLTASNLVHEALVSVSRLYRGTPCLPAGTGWSGEGLVIIGQFAGSHLDGDCALPAGHGFPSAITPLKHLVPGPPNTPFGGR